MSQVFCVQTSQCCPRNEDDNALQAPSSKLQAPSSKLPAPSSQFLAPRASLKSFGPTLVLAVLAQIASRVSAQTAPGQVVHVSHSTHDHTTTVGSPLDLPEAWADVKSTGGIPGVPVPSGTAGERLTYKVGSIGVTNTRFIPTFSGVGVLVSPALTFQPGLGVPSLIGGKEYALASRAGVMSRIVLHAH